MRRRRMTVPLWMPGMFALWLWGCGGADGQQPGEQQDGAFVTCATDGRAMPYQPGMSVVSLGGGYAVTLISSTPGPPVKGQNAWLLGVTDTASHAPVDDLRLDVSPFMPDHQHGTTIPVVAPAPGGGYDVNPVYLYMSGLWEVHVTLSGGGTADMAASKDQATLSVCIP